MRSWWTGRMRAVKCEYIHLLRTRDDRLTVDLQLCLRHQQTDIRHSPSIELLPTSWWWRCRNQTDLLVQSTLVSYSSYIGRIFLFWSYFSLLFPCYGDQSPPTLFRVRAQWRVDGKRSSVGLGYYTVIVRDGWQMRENVTLQVFSGRLFWHLLYSPVERCEMDSEWRLTKWATRSNTKRLWSRHSSMCTVQH